MSQRNLIKFYLANIITCLNLLFGFFSILSTFAGLHLLAMLFIIIAVFWDYLDGIVARFFDSQSDFGKYLDSHADLVSFGVAPALMFFSHYYFVLPVHNFLSLLTIIVALLYLICSALRLSRYNAQKFDGYYRGLTITASGLIATIATFFLVKTPLVMSLLMIVLSLLMISNFKLKKI